LSNHETLTSPSVLGQRHHRRELDTRLAAVTHDAATRYHVRMNDDANITTVTDRGQVSIPAGLRSALNLVAGQKLLWEMVSDRELRVRALGTRTPSGARAMLGFARRLRSEGRRTSEWMTELREGER
jgi:AbrB family looped-hinge helix DNA binding protein